MNNNNMVRMDDGSSMMKLYIYSMLSFTVVCWVLVGGLYYYVAFIRVDPDSGQMSSVMERLANLIKLLEELQAKVNMMLTEDPFLGLIKEQVKPLFDELASVKKQTTIYEKMERIPGGPQQFMSTAMSTSIKLGNRIAAVEHEYRAIVYLTQDSRRSLDEKLRQISRDLFVLMKKKAEELSRVMIALPEASPANYRGNTSLAGLLTIINDIIPLFTEYEITSDELDQLREALGFPNPFQIKQMRGTPAEEMAIRHLQSDNAISVFVEQNAEILSTSGMIIFGFINELNTNMTALISHIDKQKKKYEKLVNIFDADLHQTEKRIQNLKYPATKQEL